MPAQRPAQVLILDNMRMVFMRDPFDSKTIGLSLFAEGSHRIADSDDQRKRLACFVPEESSRLPLPVVSSALLRGPLPVVQEFYRSMLAELAAHEDTFSITKLVQGVFNKLSYFGGLRFPVIVHPNGAEAYFDRRRRGGAFHRYQARRSHQRRCAIGGTRRASRDRADGPTAHRPRSFQELNVAGSKNLIMGTWTNLPFQGLEQFIASLRRTSFDGDVCVFVDAVPPATVKALMAHGVIVERAARFALPQLNFQASRYHNYQEFLGRYGDDYEKVMMIRPARRPVPVRSVRHAMARGPGVRAGTPPPRRLHDQIGAGLPRAYGEAMADNLRYCMISCSGTTFGTVHAMQRYLELMINELASSANPDNRRSRPGCP